MSESWAGFTQEEIKNISNQRNSNTSSNESNQNNNPVKKIPFKFGKKNMTRERMLKTSNKQQRRLGEPHESLPHSARLSIPQIPEEDEIEESTPCSARTVVNFEPTPAEPTTDSEVGEDLIDKPSAFLSITKEKSLDEFEKRQKMIQEQNRQKKEILKKALQDRTRKTHEEARRLGHIEEELKKLDVKLSNDVYILRNQIEIASLDFMEAQKRFDRAEKEYLDAKLALFTKREHKELLTGHLCTIIEQNELRKAKKLSDLMNKLDLSSVVIEKSLPKITDGLNGENASDEKVDPKSPVESVDGT